MATDEVILFGGKPGRVGKTKVDEYDPDDIDDATAFDDAEDDGETMDEADDSESYDEAEDDDSEAMDEADADDDTAAMKSKKSGKKMSEGAQRFAEMNEYQLREYIVRQQYEQQIEKLLTAWESGKRVEFAETRSAVKEPRGGTVTTRSGKVVMSPKLKQMIKAHLLSTDSFRMSDSARAGFLEIIQVALSEGLVDLSKRGASFDMEAPKATRRTRGNETGVELHEKAVALAQASGKTFAELSPDEKKSYYLLAEKQ